MPDGITLRVLGDYGPFSRMGKSIAYHITVGSSSYLIDCGAPLFQQIGGQGIKDVSGLIITHCHDDHKRWFSDLALFSRYAPDVSKKIFLLTSEDVYQGLLRSAGPALESSLSNDSQRVIDISYDDYIRFGRLGPRARYRIVLQNGKDGLHYAVVDNTGNLLGPDAAKVIVSPKTQRPRLLFRDPDYHEWVEPASFYPFSSATFYEKKKNTYRDPAGFTIDAISSPVWHGMPGIGLKIATPSETLVISSDTVHNTHLWKKLAATRRRQRLRMSQRAFDRSSVITGDINDYIERTWSEDRYQDALNTFCDATVLHDISIRDSIVHTDYSCLGKTCLDKNRTILTHSPDRITSEWVLCKAEKTYRIRGDEFFEVVDGRLLPLNADIYHKEAGRYYVGYRHPRGTHAVYEQKGLLKLSPKSEEGGFGGRLLYRVRLYEDISGRYFPVLKGEKTIYFERRDRKVEKISFSQNGSTGRVIRDLRESLLKT